MTKLGFITFDEKLEAAWGLHKIEKAVLEREIAELRAENEQLKQERDYFKNIVESDMRMAIMSEAEGYRNG